MSWWLVRSSGGGTSAGSLVKRAMGNGSGEKA